MTRLAFAAALIAAVACSHPGLALAAKSDFPEYELDKFQKTDSGLMYRIIKAGGEAKPSAESNVEVHYHGTLPNGQKFDSSYDRGTTITFPLNRVIKGWTEGVQLIGEGGQIQLVCPADLAYGDRSPSPLIPPGSTLYFNVELIKIQ